MCTRYYMELSPELKPYIDRATTSPLKDRMVSNLARPLKTEGEIRPTDMAPVIAPDLSVLPSSQWCGDSQTPGKAGPRSLTAG